MSDPSSTYDDDIESSKTKLDLNLHITGNDDQGYHASYQFVDGSHSGAFLGTSVEDVKASLVSTVADHLGISQNALDVIENVSVDPDISLDKGQPELKGITVSYTVKF